MINIFLLTYRLVRITSNPNHYNRLECTVYWSVEHFNNNCGTIYIIWWYRYDAKNNRIEPAVNILRHSISRHWTRKRSKSFGKKNNTPVADIIVLLHLLQRKRDEEGGKSLRQNHKGTGPKVNGRWSGASLFAPVTMTTTGNPQGLDWRRSFNSTASEV